MEPFAGKLSKRLGTGNPNTNRTAAPLTLTPTPGTVLHLSLNFGACPFEKQMFVQKTLAQTLPAAVGALQKEQAAERGGA
jgi:hypothetical protein